MCNVIQRKKKNKQNTRYNIPDANIKPEKNALTWQTK